MSRTDVISDRSKEKLKELPKEILEKSYLKMLFLEGNFLRTLPENFFWKLPNLVWLDLRNNLLECLPKSIAHHQNLENLLLTNNNLHSLPNELGLVPKLKALQIADNPLVYPAKQVIVEGTKAIKNYLRDQYDKFNMLTSPDPTSEEDLDWEPGEERVINVINDSSTENLGGQTSSSGGYRKKRSSKTVSENLKKKLSDPKMLQPTLKVKKLTSGNTTALVTAKKGDAAPMKIVHKIDRTGSKICLKSTFNKLGTRTVKKPSDDNTLKEGWLNQLRILLNDQERILQQERNLRALSSWRLNKKLSAPPKVFRENKNSSSISDPPYGTDPEYSKMPTRKELAAQLNNFFKEKGIVVAQESRNRDVNIDKLINDLMQQLKEMESEHGVTGSPRSEMDRAGRQIKTIMNIQKKLLQLKSSTNF